MVCPRCISAVQKLFVKLDIPVSSIKLGEVVTVRNFDEQQKNELSAQLRKLGFEMLNDKTAQIINKIKSIIVQEIHYNQDYTNINFSSLLSSKLHYDYAYLSRLFSSVESRTIEKYIIAQKIEKVKELLTYSEKTLSEIAIDMSYSSVAHLSGQFKKVTGMPPSSFKKLHLHNRQTLDRV